MKFDQTTGGRQEKPTGAVYKRREKEG